MSYHYFQCTVGFAARQVEFPPAAAPVFSHCAVPCGQGRALLQARAAARRLPCPGARGTLHVTGKCGTIGTGRTAAGKAPPGCGAQKRTERSAFMNVFDIIGPVMIGPSSSHTAGAARLGRIARALLGQRPVRADILLHGSFAKTYRGHGTDKAIVAGVLGMAPDDARIRESLALAQMTGLAVSIAPGEIDGAHPNTARIALWGEEGGHICMQGASVGGGNILVTQVNGLPVELDGAHAALVVVHLDAPGTIAAVTEEMSRAGANICNFRLARAAKGGTAVMTIEVDGALEAAVAERVQALANVQAVTLLAPV